MGGEFWSAKPESNCNQFDHYKVVVSKFFEARSDAAKMIDPIEESFDVIAFIIKGLEKAMTILAFELVGNVRCGVVLAMTPQPDS